MCRAGRPPAGHGERILILQLSQLNGKDKVPDLKHNLQSSRIKLNRASQIILFHRSFPILRYSHLSLLLATTCYHLSTLLLGER